MKKIIILSPDGGELANQLWNYISIYAYAQEIGAEIHNDSFYEYGGYFNIPHSFLAGLFLFAPFKNYRGRKQDLKPRIWRKAYGAYVKIISYFQKDNLISSISKQNTAVYLPPTNTPLTALKNPPYTVGWLFRNPIGIQKYRAEILKYFAPQEKVVRSVATFIGNARTQYKTLIGIHIRQGDYKNWKEGKYYIEHQRVREIINEYIATFQIDISTTAFPIASDGHIDQSYFSGLNILVSNMSAVEDLFMLAQTDCILGSDSSFGDFAAWWGNKTHIIFKNEPIDWQYYTDKKDFFENKYCTMVHY